MRADHDFYLGRLYPMQDRILARLASIETGFYLTGVARVLLSVTKDDWQLVRWRDAPESNRFIGDLTALGERLLLLHS